MGKSNSLITIVLVALIALAAGWYVGQQDLVTLENEEEVAVEEETSVVVEIPEKEEPVLPTLENVIFQVPEQEGVTTTIMLDGEIFTGNFTIDEESEGTVTVVDNQLTAVNETNFVVPFVVNNGGTGTFMYLALLNTTDESTAHVDSQFLGDRVGFETLLVEKNIVTVETLDRYEGQAMAEDPTTPVINRFLFQSTGLQHTETFVNVDPDDIEMSASLTAETVFPITITGTVPAGWVFEGDFPAQVMLAGEEVLLHYATQGFEEETFTGTLEPEELPEDLEGELAITIFRDNASDDRSLDARYTKVISR